MTKPRPKSTLRIVLLSVTIAAVGLMAGMLVLRFSGISIWDDAYFFSRYADHYLNEGGFVWNVDETPAYGATSVAYLVFVTSLRSIFQGDPAFALYLGSFLSGLLALAAMSWLVWRYADDLRRYGLQVLVLLSITAAFNIPQLSAHFSSGMDTMAAMAYLAVYLSVVWQFEAKLSPGKALVIGVLGGLAWFVRPDLLVFTVGIPFGWALLSRRKLVRLQASYVLIFTAFAMLTQAMLAAQTFEMFFPLSFYAKSMNLYGPATADAYHLEGLRQLGLFLLTNWLPVLLTGTGIYFGLRRWRAAFSLTERLLFFCLLLFFLYHAFFVLPIMGYQQRFLYPVLPVLLFLGARSLVFLYTEKGDLLRRFLPAPGTLQAILPGLGVLVIVGGLAWWQRPHNTRQAWGDFSTNTVYQTLGKHNWPGLDRFSRLPNDLSIAATELGILAAMNPQRRIVDMTGLHDPILARDGFRANRLLEKQKPDLIYLPHPDYAQMQALLEEEPAYHKDYEVYSAAKLGSWLGLALRKESRYYHLMKFIAEEEVAARP